MKFRHLLVLLLALTVTCVAAQSAADMGAGTQNRKASF
jgi:carboxyl-terminal processing protease